MKALDRLLIADLKRMWSQALAICAVLACGVATFVMSTTTMRSITATYEDYYREYRFADVFASLKRAPNHFAARLQDIPGVDRVETRVVRDVIVDIPAMIEPATCRLVSTPDDRTQSLNDVHLLRGRLPEPDQRSEVLASEQFAKAHSLRPGDELKVIMGGREEQLRIVGIAMSPEYILAVPPGMLLPDDRRFGVLWMPYRQMAAAFNMEGAFNDTSFTLRGGASADDVIFHIDRLCEQYGGLGAYTRDDQISHRRVADEIHQLDGMAYVSPVIFLSVAAFLFNLVLSRLVRHQQEQIATLRAFGYLASEIGVHYLKLLLLLVAAGSLLGTGVGLYLAHELTQFFVRFFRFPAPDFEIAWSGIGIAACLSLLAALAGGVTSVRHAMRLPPAVAMRPEAPPSYRRSLAERLGLGRWLSPVASMVLRRLERNRRSTALSILGMSLGVAVLVLGSFMEDTIDYVMEVQFQLAQRQDVTLTFDEALSARALHDAEHLPGVARAEPFRSAPARLSRGARSRKVTLLGLEEHPQLFRVLDAQERQVRIAPGGLTISQKLAEVLDAEVGDELEVEFLEGRKVRRAVPIAMVFPDYTDPGAYMNRHELHRLLREGECLSGAFLAVDPARVDDLHRQLKQTPAVVGVTVKQAAVQAFQDTIAENLRPMRLTYAIFASIIAFGVIYNCALITLAERARDLATLRVLGFTRREVSAVLLGELAIITLAALPIGLPAGYGLSYFATLALDTETHRFPLVVSRATFAYASGVILAAAAASAVICRRMIDKLDLIAVLKVKE